MRTTIKEYNAKLDERRAMKNLREDAKMHEDWSMVNLLDNSLKMLQESYFDLLDTVNVKFWIGWRTYYRNVIKIGKQYFTNGEKMTKSRGYSSVEEIEEITEKMQQEMIADSYYY